MGGCDVGNVLAMGATRRSELLVVNLLSMVVS